MSAASKRSPSLSKEQITSSTTTSSSLTTTTTSSSSASSTAKTPIGQSIRESVFNMIQNRTSTANGDRNRSPVSPSRISRLQEKEEMQNLNERLVIYIDTVRRLETENQRLQQQVTSFQEKDGRHIADIKEMYARELEDAKRLIDELAKEKARFEIEVNKYKAESEEAQAKLTRREKDVRSLEQRLKNIENEAIEYKSRYEQLQVEQSRNRDELSQLKPHISDLEKQLSKLKKQLEDETLLRVDLENKNQTLREDLMFKTQVYDKEVDQLRSSKRVEIEQVDVRLRDEYDSRLVSELQRIREDAELKILEMKDEVERRYHNKLADLEAQCKRNLHLNNTLREESTTHKTKVEELQNEIKQLLAKISLQESKVRELEDKLARQSSKYEKDLTEKEAEMNGIRKELQDLLLEYQELYDIKIALDMEIGAYRKLLESEEQRLNISTVAQHSQLGSSFMDQSNNTNTGRGGKKRRLASAIEPDEPVTSSTSTLLNVSYKQSSQSPGGIEILDHDFEGRWVKLLNKTDKDVPINGWTLKRNADNQLTDYKFNKTVIKPGQEITVYSSNLPNVTHEPPSNLVMNSQRWNVGDSMITVLVDKDGVEQARRESQKVASTTSEKKLKQTSPIKGNSSNSSLVNVSTASNGNDSKKGSFFSFWKT